jgi:hypothetical protein
LSTSNLGAWIAADEKRFAGAILIAYVLLGLLLVRLVLLNLAPLRLLAWNSFLDEHFSKVPGWLDWGTSAVKNALLIGFFQYHSRVLAAWTEEKAVRARDIFFKLSTPNKRTIFKPLPVSFDGQIIDDLKPSDLHTTTGRPRWTIMIQGEGGIGKTALACQLAQWALAPRPQDRLCSDRLLLPVLVEPGQSFDLCKDIEAFKADLRGRLREVIDSPAPIPEIFFEKLLRDRRILVILDGASEMTGVLDPNRADFTINALLVTSRRQEHIEPTTILHPQRIDSNHLLPFLNAYLAKSGTQLDDATLYRSTLRLAEMVQRRPITPLLARLFVETLIATAKDGGNFNTLPATVPDLMLSYINNLNENVKRNQPNAYENTVVQQAAMLVAWECLKHDFRPGQVAAKDSLDVEPELLEYLEKRLQIIRTPDPRGKKIQFLLDPLSEYLAALYLVETLGADSIGWNTLFDQLPTDSSEIVGFLMALRDCCSARKDDYNIPEWVLPKVDDRLTQGRLM